MSELKDQDEIAVVLPRGTWSKLAAVAEEAGKNGDFEYMFTDESTKEVKKAIAKIYRAVRSKKKVAK